MKRINIIKKILKILTFGAIGLFALFVAIILLFGEEHVCSKLSSKELKQLEKRAEAGDIQACKDLSYHFCEDDELMAKWDKKAADLGDAESKYRYGSFLISNKRYSEGINYITHAAEQGYWFAQYVLGNKYSTGEHVEKNINYAAYWLNKAANQGEVIAMIDLSKLYIENYDDKKHLNESYKLAVLASMIRNDNAYYNAESTKLKDQIKEKSLKARHSFEAVASQGQAAALKAFATIPKKN